MDAGQIALLIPVAAIIMGGLVKISRNMSQGNPGSGSPELESRIERLEHELGSVRQELSEAQERLDFTERLLARGREEKPEKT
jgi:hypothetical protein